MKKALVLILVAVMLLSLVPAVVSAEDKTANGPFITLYDAANAEKEDPNNPGKEKTSGKTMPLAGYKYDENGFHVISPTYSTNPFTHLAAWEPFKLTENNDAEGGHIMSVEFTMDEFAYDGGNGSDEWICLSITDKQAATPGGAKYQDGLFILLRGKGNGGNIQAQPHYDSGTSFSNANIKTGVAVPVGEDGKEKYSFHVDLVDGKYKLFVNDVDVTASDGTTAAGKTLEQLFEGFKDKAYFQITVQTGYFNTTEAAKNNISLTINKYNGLVPLGTDEKDPISNESKKAELADPNTIPANKPALIWDSTKSSFDGEYGGGYTYTDNADGTVHVKNTGNYFYWTIKDSLSYAADDFGYVCILTKVGSDAIASGIVSTTYYCSDDVLTPKDGCTDGSSYDTELGEGWVLTVLDGLAYKWTGRINALRIHFRPEEFDIGWVGCFRSEKEGLAYATEYLADKGITVTTAEATTRKPKTTKATTTAAPTPGTTAPETTAAEEKSGCKSTVAMIALVPVMAAAYVFTKKKHD